MHASKLRIVLTWAVLAGFLLVVFRAFNHSSAPFALSLAMAVVVSTLIIGFARGRRAIARVQELLALGEPDKMMSIVRRKLRYARPGSPNHAAFSVFMATALSMKGDWERALEVLDQVDPESVPDDNPALWRFGLHNARFSSLVFTEQIEEARAVFRDQLEPLVKSGELANAEAAVEACRAVMWFCDGEHDRAMKVFSELVKNTPIPPPSRAVFHYFLGRIYHDRGEWNARDQHFEEAARLAPNTWVPAGIEAFLESKKLAP